MPFTTFPLDPTLGGPVTEIGLAAPLSQQPAGAPPPVIYWAKSLVDTGCSHTAIHSSVAQKSGLPVIGKIPIHNTSQNNIIVNAYLGDMFIKCGFIYGTMEFRFVDRQFTELLAASPNFETLLGMDIIGLGVLVVNGSVNSATFSW
jgi:hypothetical protein